MERRSGWELGVPARIYLPARHRAPMFIALVLVAFAFQPLGLVSFVYLGLGPTPRCGGWVPGVCVLSLSSLLFHSLLFLFPGFFLFLPLSPFRFSSQPLFLLSGSFFFECSALFLLLKKSGSFFAFLLNAQDIAKRNLILFVILSKPDATFHGRNGGHGTRVGFKLARRVDRGHWWTMLHAKRRRKRRSVSSLVKSCVKGYISRVSGEDKGETYQQEYVLNCCGLLKEIRGPSPRHWHRPTHPGLQISQAQQLRILFLSHVYTKCFRC